MEGRSWWVVDGTGRRTEWIIDENRSMADPAEHRTRYPGIYSYATSSGDTRYLFRVRDREGRSVKRRGFSSIARARAARSELEGEVRQGSYTSTAAGRVTIEQCWNDYFAAKATRLKPSSLYSLERSWRSYVGPRWGDVAASRVSRRAIQQWATALAAGETVPMSQIARQRQRGGARSPTVVIRAVEVLRGALQVAVEDKRIASNPALGIEVPRKSRGKTGAARRYLARASVRDVAGVCRTRSDRLLFLTLALSGLRWGEAIGLHVEDVEASRGRLRVERSAAVVDGTWHVTAPKAWERRTVPIPRHLADELAAFVEGSSPGDLVFPSPRDPAAFRPLPNHVRADGPGRPHWFQAALMRAGVSYLSPHDLRHTAASLAVQSGANVKAVQRMLGHESAALTLDVYSDLFDSDLDEVAARGDAAWRALG